MIAEHGQPARVPVRDGTRRRSSNRRARSTIGVKEIAPINRRVLPDIAVVPTNVSGVGVPVGFLLSRQNVISILAIEVAKQLLRLRRCAWRDRHDAARRCGRPARSRCPACSGSSSCAGPAAASGLPTGASIARSAGNSPASSRPAAARRAAAPRDTSGSRNSPASSRPTGGDRTAASRRATAADRSAAPGHTTAADRSAAPERAACSGRSASVGRSPGSRWTARAAGRDSAAGAPGVNIRFRCGAAVGAEGNYDRQNQGFLHGRTRGRRAVDLPEKGERRPIES